MIRLLPAWILPGRKIQLRPLFSGPGRICPPGNGCSPRRWRANWPATLRSSENARRISCAASSTASTSTLPAMKTNSNRGATARRVTARASSSRNGSTRRAPNMSAAGGIKSIATKSVSSRTWTRCCWWPNQPGARGSISFRREKRAASKPSSSPAPAAGWSLRRRCVPDIIERTRRVARAIANCELNRVAWWS